MFWSFIAHPPAQQFTPPTAGQLAGYAGKMGQAMQAITARVPRATVAIAGWTARLRPVSRRA
jgi:hypothetical protein